LLAESSTIEILGEWLIYAVLLFVGLFRVRVPAPSRRSGSTPVAEERVVKSYMCVICGLIYEEEKGWPDEGIPPGTRWDDVPLNWKCPECGAGKEDFEMVEV
jgi:rubredoxin